MAAVAGELRACLRVPHQARRGPSLLDGAASFRLPDLWTCPPPRIAAALCHPFRAGGFEERDVGQRLRVVGGVAAGGAASGARTARRGGGRERRIIWGPAAHAIELPARLECGRGEAAADGRHRHQHPATAAAAGFPGPALAAPPRRARRRRRRLVRLAVLAPRRQPRDRDRNPPVPALRAGVAARGRDADRPGRAGAASRRVRLPAGATRRAPAGDLPGAAAAGGDLPAPLPLAPGLDGRRAARHRPRRRSDRTAA